MLEKEFKVNEYIVLKLEGGDINIYVNGKLFDQCKFLLVNVPVEEKSSIDKIESINDVARRLGWKKGDWGEFQKGDPKFKIPPEDEFWGHCSNLQAWAENHYDARLLHSSLAIPLLRALVDAGDPKAKEMWWRLRKEVAKRILSGNEEDDWQLIEEGYIEMFTEDELDELLQKFEEYLDMLIKEYSGKHAKDEI